MPESNDRRPHRDEVQYTSEDCILIEIREEDTKPGTPEASAVVRKWMEAKYGKEASSPKPPEAS